MYELGWVWVEKFILCINGLMGQLGRTINDPIHPFNTSTSACEFTLWGQGNNTIWMGSGDDLWVVVVRVLSDGRVGSWMGRPSLSGRRTKGENESMARVLCYSFYRYEYAWSFTALFLPQTILSYTTKSFRLRCCNILIYHLQEKMTISRSTYSV